MSLSPEYHAWRAMIDRCSSVGSRSYPHYGGRGIKVCDRWLESFENFFADMGHRPDSRSSLDRIDVNGNYESINCRWADSITQANNKRPRLCVEDYSDEVILAEVKRRGIG